MHLQPKHQKDYIHDGNSPYLYKQIEVFRVLNMHFFLLWQPPEAARPASIDLQHLRLKWH